MYRSRLFCRTFTNALGRHPRSARRYQQYYKPTAPSQHSRSSVRGVYGNVEMPAAIGFPFASVGARRKKTVPAGHASQLALGLVAVDFEECSARSCCSRVHRPPRSRQRPAATSPADVYSQSANYKTRERPPGRPAVWQALSLPSSRSVTVHIPTF